MIEFTRIPWLNHLIFAAVVILCAFLIFRILRFFLRRFLKRSSEQLKVDPTNYTFLNNGLNLIVIILTFTILLYSIPGFKKIGVALFAGAGIFAAIIGFASQAAFSNIISGIFIVIFKPYRVGDIVKVANEYGGLVEDITLRHTVIKDFENKRYVVPNSIISNVVINNSNIYDERVANFVFMNISYEADLDKAIEIFRDEAMRHPLIRDGRSPEEIAESKPQVDIRLIEVGESSLRLRAKCWTDDFASGFDLKTDLHRSVKLRFDREGIEIPYPHRTIVEKKHGKIS